MLYMYKRTTSKLNSPKEPQQLAWSTSKGMMCSAYKNTDALLLEVLETERCRWPVTHLSSVEYPPQAESLRADHPAVGKYNYSSSIRFKTRPGAEKSLLIGPVVTCTL